MQRLLLPLAIALFSAGPLVAQSTGRATPDTTHVSEECLLGMKAQEWGALGLTAEQITQVQAVQTDCKTDCVALKQTAATDPAMSHAALEKHQERIGRILTKEQYDKWIAWCKERPGHTWLLKAGRGGV